jgi:long-chain acyl-CoA synthetase
VLIADIARRNATFFGDDDAVIDLGGGQWTWAGLDDWSSRMAAVFVDLGVEVGDPVAVLAPNCATYLSFFFACSKSGALGAPLNIRLTASELGAYLAYVEPKALLVHASLASVGRTLAAAVPTIEHLVGFGGVHGLSIDLDEAVAAASPAEPRRSVDSGTLYMLAATSGTTGVSKAAALTNANALAAIASHTAELPIGERETVLQNIPLFFNPGGPAGLHAALGKGGRSVIAPGFEPGTFLEAVPRFDVNHTILVPTMIQMVLDHPAAATADLSTLRSVVCGGSPLSKELLLAAREVFGDVFRPTYGLAETYSCGLVLRPQNQRPDGDATDVRRLGSAGKPHILTTVKVVADDGAEVPHDGEAIGEVLVRGDMVAAGYYRMPEETALAFADGWMHTGDLATVDEGHFVTIVDRKKDIIITGGINVHSREVEEALLRHPAVSQAAAIGIPHPQWGEAVHAVVVAAPGVDLDPDEVLAFCAGELAGFKRPRSLEVRDELPISGTGKVLKRVLRETARAG